MRETAVGDPHRSLFMLSRDPMSNLKSNLVNQVVNQRSSRGRPPKKAFINVLVRTSTRAALTQLKGSLGLASQGEVIDHLIEHSARRQLASAERSS